LTDSKVENARAFGISEIKSREHPHSLSIREDQDNCSREHPCWQFGSDLVLIAPRRAVLYSRPGYGVVTARSGFCRARGAGRAACGVNARHGARGVWGAERVVRCARGAGAGRVLFTKLIFFFFMCPVRSLGRWRSLWPWLSCPQPCERAPLRFALQSTF